ncbi:efflux RND transporter periplasmic adaptor subunit [Dickeya fangzhongdai]|uniref:efflux RND transporter periplasmic adaptor subunit n=1 Tax=Dickeya fangzhongdai TaxID=1778540 RepID=UPI0004F6B57B|nr:HlyD family efflux transporter periplasmic adaptor subunit [Dickeya fangzhongdai]AIR68616.1 secretion protein HlyD [Dickeya fangzhongdai]KGT99357.1 secretion protein HlyD [Dickeya fangzhongdai]KHN62555.1 secretion protein HlyD [Dickeya fangzhongdai]WPD76820.1 HlyD family efflux transporter periplasmic adaptor subunit [Dickeya fangzhongdai]
MKVIHLASSLVMALALSACDAEKPSPPAAQSAPWVAIAKGYISIEGGMISIDAPRAGIIKQILAEEGDEVKKGQLLAQIDDNEAELSLRQSLTSQDEATQDVATSKTKLEIAEREYRRVLPLGTQIISDQSKQNLKDQMSLAREDLAGKKAALETAKAKVASAQLEVDKFKVLAPENGKIVRRYAKPGEGSSTLNVTRLFTLAPDAPRIVRAEIEDIFVDNVRPGQLAEVTLENNEKKVYQAKVLRLSEVFGPSVQNTDDPTAKQDTRVIECVLSLDAPKIKLGQRVMVKIYPLGTVPPVGTPAPAAAP